MNRGRIAMGARRFRAIVRMAALLGSATFCAASLADAPGEVHGSGDAYASAGVALAWGILRGADEASTQVVIRVAADPKVYPLVAAVSRNPFSGKEQVLLAATPTGGHVDVRVARAQFAEFPRSELRFYASATTTDPPALVVFYLGVPDTAPELVGEAKLDAYFSDRLKRAGAAAGKSP